MKLIILLFILSSGVIFNVAYADSSLIGMKGSGIAVGPDFSKMYTSSIRIFLYNQTSIASGLVTISTDQGTILAKMIPNEWKFTYNNDGSFHGTGPIISRQGISYDLTLDGSRLHASQAAGSMWRVGADMASNAQNYLLEYLVSGTDPLGNTNAPPTATVTIPNGNSAQSSTGFFVPLNLEILRGTKVTWQNHDNIGHTIQSINDKGVIIPMFNSPVLKTGDIFGYKFDKAGVYYYYCSIHPWRIGMITVL